MANLKELRNKIGTIQSIKKVTAAMKLVAGVKLKTAEQKAEASREYAHELSNVLSGFRREFLDVNCKLLDVRKRITAEMLLVLGSDRGLCGNFNYLIYNETEKIISKLHDQNRRICLLCIGTRLFEPLKRLLNENDSIELIKDFYKSEELLQNSQKLAKQAISDFESEKIDRVSIVYTRYYTVIRHNIEVKPLVPVPFESSSDRTNTIFEPSEEKILSKMLPYNVAIQIHQYSCESIASEQSSRMTSMDNATRNADDLLADLTLKYNRLRQYGITQELAEVVSGAESISKG